MLKPGGFWHRFVSALVSATFAFVPFYYLAAISFGNIQNQYEQWWVWLLNSLDTFAICEVVIVAAIFIIAYPVERFFNSPAKSAFRNAATYAFIGIVLGSIFFVLGLVNTGSGNYWPAIGLYATAIGAITAFLGRLVYPFFLKLQRTSLATTAIIVALAIAGPAVPQVVANSPQADDFYPATMTGEVARASWDVNENDNSAGTHQTLGTGWYNPNQKYIVTYRCREASGAKFNVLIRDQASMATLNTLPIICNSSMIESAPVELGKKPLDVSIYVEPLGNDTSTHPDTWAVLAPVSY